MVIGRFAPSPSGRMHLGNVFSALMAWLFVRAGSGKMLLRIEDLDPDRCKSEYAEQFRKDLQWLGLDWDEEQPPQSTRTEAYRAAFARIAEKGLVYPCFCSRAELHAASAPHASDGQTVYAGTCRNLTPAQRAENPKPPCWRVIVPEKTVSFTDGLQGVYSEDLQTDCGDFILRRADGVYAYQLAVVVDDAAGGVTQVVRGKDLLSSVPRQMYLQSLLGFATPEYYHVPLLLSKDGRRLSKRDGGFDLGELQKAHTAQELLGKLAHLSGLTDRAESMSAQELITVFSPHKIKKENILADISEF